jgi:indole-3-glycerol phosphate synthase
MSDSNLPEFPSGNLPDAESTPAKPYIRLRVGLAVIRDEKILLTPHMKEDSSIVWHLPSGQVEFGESLTGAALREFYDETGVRAQCHDLIDVVEEIEQEVPWHTLTHVYRGSIALSPFQPEPGPDFGVKMGQWFTRDELRWISYHPRSVIDKAIMSNSLGKLFGSSKPPLASPPTTPLNKTMPNSKPAPFSPKGIQQTNTILDKIVARKIEEIAKLPALIAFGARSRRTSPPRDFAAALRRDCIALIAEVKHASPSKGVLIEDFDPVQLGTTYAQAGAAAISVLTDQDFFKGSLDDLKRVRDIVSVPTLRKDFIIDARQIAEAHLANADAILLIVAILDDARLRDLHQAVIANGLTPLIEVHTEAEMERALKLAPRLIGINNRDLHTFAVDIGVTTRLASIVPPEVTLVSESGIFSVADVETVAAAGAHAILVGESLVKAGNVSEQVKLLSSVSRKPL